jgi:hypothetical protein
VIFKGVTLDWQGGYSTRVTPSDVHDQGLPQMLYSGMTMGGLEGFTGIGNSIEDCLYKAGG